jgi:hypothetical protein
LDPTTTRGKQGGRRIKRTNHHNTHNQNNTKRQQLDAKSNPTRRTKINNQLGSHVTLRHRGNGLAQNGTIKQNNLPPRQYHTQSIRKNNASFQPTLEQSMRGRHTPMKMTLYEREQNGK